MRNNFFDIHTHYYKYPFINEARKIMFPNKEELYRAHEKFGITGGALMCLVNAEEYQPQSVGEVIDMAKESGGRYVPFCNVDPRAIGNSKDSELELLLEFFKNQGCVGVGEVLPKMEFDDPKLLNLYRASEKMELPLLFDMYSDPDRTYGVSDEPGLIKLKKCLEKFPNLIFIGHGPGFWAEFGTLRKPEDRYGWPTYDIDGEGAVFSLMREYKNLYVDLSAGSGLGAMKRNLNYTKKFLNEFQDRIMYGSDICYHDDYIGQTDFMNKMLDENYISEKVYDKIARENAKKLLKIETK